MNTLPRTAAERWATHGLLASIGGLATVATTGCQVDIGGQTLPSAYYLQDLSLIHI